MTIEIVEISTQLPATVTVAGSPTEVTITTVASTEVIEVGVIGPQGPPGPEGPAAFPSADAGNKVTFGADLGLFVPDTMVWKSTNW